MPPVDLSASAAALELDRMTRQFEDLKEQGRHPATVVAHRHGRRSQQAHRIALPWRNRRNARQALVASIVLAPPKGLEP